MNQSIFMAPSIGPQSRKNKEKSPTLSRSSGEYRLKLSYMERRLNERESCHGNLAEPSKEKISELAAIILCRTQLRRGQPEEALNLMEKYIEKYGLSPMIENELKKIKETLNRV